MDSGSDFQFNNGILTVSDGATMDICTANGTVVAIGRKDPVDLTNRPAGVYLVKINKNGASTIYKVVAGSKH